MKRLLIILTFFLSCFASNAQFSMEDRVLLNDSIESIFSSVYDFDNDGYEDIVASYEGFDQGVVWYKNNGDRTFEHSEILIPALGFVSTVQCGDFSNDSSGDLIVGNHDNGDVWYYENIGANIFLDPILIGSDLQGISQIRCSDITNNGWVDIIVLSEYNHKVVLFENLGQGQFSDEIVLSESISQPRSCLVVDMNNDDKLDIVIGGGNGVQYITYIAESPQEFFISSTPVQRAPDGGKIETFVSTVDPENTGYPHILIAKDDGSFELVKNFGGLLSNYSEIENSQSSMAEIADVNSDSIEDLILISEQENSISLLLGESGFQFEDPFIIYEGFGSISKVVAHDINGDNLIDISCSFSDNDEILILLNDNENSFENQTLVETEESSIVDFKWADLDDNGSADLTLLEDEDHDLLIYSQTDNLIFDQPISLGTFNDAFTFDFANYGDDLKDVVCFNDSEGIQLLNNEGNLNFSDPTLIHADNGDLNAIKTKDLDGDGIAEIIYRRNSSVMKILKSLDGISFELLHSQSIGSHTPFSIGQLDDDPSFEVVLYHVALQEIFYWDLVEGEIEYGSLMSSPVNPIDFIQLTDLNNSGQDEFVVTSISGESLAYIQKVGTWTAQEAEPFHFGQVTSVGTVEQDIDNNGINELVVFGDPNQIYQYSFGNYEHLTDLDCYTKIDYGLPLVGDFDNDGQLDLVLENYQTKVIFNGSNGGLWNEIFIAPPGESRNEAYVDITGDGIKDLVAKNDLFLQYYRGQADGTFDHLKSTNLKIQNYHISTVFETEYGDINQDGLTDIVTLDEGKIQIFYNLGNDDFQDSIILMDPSIHFENHKRNIRLGDLDLDGDLDILFIAELEWNEIQHFAWLENEGGNFSYHEIQDCPFPQNYNTPTREFNLADMDFDGDLDIYISATFVNNFYGVVWIENLGAGNFISECSEIQSEYDGFSFDELNIIYDNYEIGDFNNDGTTDISYNRIDPSLLDGSSPSPVNLFLIRGNEDGSFNEPENILEFALPNFGSYSAPTYFWSDLNNDQLPDVIVQLNTLSNFGVQMFAYFQNSDNSFNESYEILDCPNCGVSTLREFEDINNDGDVDFVMVNHEGQNGITVTLNVSTFANLENDIFGCTDPLSCNYSEIANNDDGSCCFGECGCTNEIADNYNPQAACDDNSCIIPSDLNNDGIIDINDLLEFLQNWGCFGTDCVGDLNGDGIVNMADLLILLVEL